MPRIRTIKPEFWENEELSALDAETVLLAVGLLNHSDDEGYFKANPGLLKAQIFPLREISLSVHEMLTELSNIGYVTLFEGSDHKDYGVIVNFVKHQKINRSSPSKIKHLRGITEDSLIPPAQITEDSLPERKGKERKGKDNAPSGRDYVFEGETIKINQQDFDKMKASYPHVDLLAQLKQLDLEVRGKKNWFMELQSKLNYRNKTPTHQSQQQCTGLAR